MARKYLGGSGEGLTVWISIAASTVLVFYGYDQGVFGNVLVKEDFLRTVGYPSTSAQGTMTSVYNLGCFAGNNKPALSTLYTGDKLGRPRVLILGSTVIAVGGIIQASCYSAAQLYVGRVVAVSLAESCPLLNQPSRFNYHLVAWEEVIESWNNLVGQCGMTF